MRYGHADGAFATAVYVFMKVVCMYHDLYLCVHSTAPSLDILLFAINVTSVISLKFHHVIYQGSGWLGGFLSPFYTRVITSKGPLP